MRIRPAVTAVAVAAFGLSLSACDSAEPAAAGSTTESTSEPTAETPASPKTGGAEDPVPDGAHTPPGTQLAFGDQAVVPFEYGDSKGTIGLTVKAVETGTEADLADFGADAEGLTPYFIQLSVANLGGTDLANTSVGVDGVLAGGGATGVILIGDSPKCENASAPADFTEIGATYETCVLSGSQGRAVTGVEFNQGEGYSDKPIIWRE